MLHLEHLLVHSRVRCREPIQGTPELQHAVQIRRTLPLSFWKDKVRDGRQRPWRLDQRACFGEEGRREPGEWSGGDIGLFLLRGE